MTNCVACGREGECHAITIGDINTYVKPAQIVLVCNICKKIFECDFDINKLCTEPNCIAFAHTGEVVCYFHLMYARKLLKKEIMNQARIGTSFKCNFKGCDQPAWKGQVLEYTYYLCSNHNADLCSMTSDVEKHHFLKNECNLVKEQFMKHETGAIRSKDADDVRYDLISPIALRALAETCAEGSAKYGDYNWEKGFPISSLLNHALRHIYLYLEGDRSEPHLGHAIWNVGAAIHSEAMWPELNKNLRGEGCVAPK